MEIIYFIIYYNWDQTVIFHYNYNYWNYYNSDSSQIDILFKIIYFKVKTVKNLISNKYIKTFMQKDNNKFNNLKKSIFIIYINLTIYR